MDEEIEKRKGAHSGESFWKDSSHSSFYIPNTNFVDINMAATVMQPNEMKLEATKMLDGFYSCHYCSKIIKNKTEMRRHIRTHTGEKLFACKLCGYHFSRKDNLGVHIKTIHRLEGGMY